MNAKLFACFAFLGGLSFIVLPVTLPAQAQHVPPPEAAVKADSSHAQIIVAPEGDLLRISGTFANGGSGLPGTLRYELAVRREGPSGTSTSRQSGAFDTRAGRTDTLSTSTVNIREGARLHIRLTILNGEQIIAEDVIDKTY